MRSYGGLGGRNVRASAMRREEFFGPLGMTVRTFVDPDKTNRVGLIVTVPDLDTLQTALATKPRPMP